MEEDRIFDIILACIFSAIILLKVFGIIQVSWWIIFSPLIAAAAFGILLFFVGGIALMINLWRNK